jgi:hypothetical protein
VKEKAEEFVAAGGEIYNLPAIELHVIECGAEATIMKPFGFSLVLLLAITALCLGQQGTGPASQTDKIEITYDQAKDRTIVRLAPVQISGQVGKYHSVHMSPAFNFSGRQLRASPTIVDFELQTVMSGRLRTDLYVVFIIDGEKVFLSSNRWAVKRPVPGRVWVGERLVFRMPYETFVKITNATTFEIKFDAMTFLVGDKEKQALRDLLTYTKPGE